MTQIQESSFQMMRHLSVALLEKKDRAAKANAWKASSQLVNVLLDLSYNITGICLSEYIYSSEIESFRGNVE